MKKHILGFTLIELLVVVAIIGILISLSFPVMSRVQESARRAAARSDMSSIVNAVNQYHSEYRRLPLTPDVHKARHTGAVSCSLTGLTVNVSTDRLDLPGAGWHHQEDGVPDRGHREMAKIVISALQGGNEFEGLITNLNPRETQFLHLQEGRPIGHFMDPWSKGYKIEDHPHNRQYSMIFDHNLNGRIAIAEFEGIISGHRVTGELIVARCAGPNRKIEVPLDDHDFDDIYSIDVEQILRSER